MRRTIFSAVLAAMLTGGPVAAQDTAIRDVIGRQLEAFEADDFEGAFEFASPGIRQLFGTPEVFGQMVRRGYPMVHRPGEVTYLDLSPTAEGFRQVVRIRDRAGQFHMLEYEMIQGAGGAWQIDSVRFLPQPEVGA